MAGCPRSEKVFPPQWQRLGGKNKCKIAKMHGPKNKNAKIVKTRDPQMFNSAKIKSYTVLCIYVYHNIPHAGNADFLAMAQIWEDLIKHYTEKNCLIRAERWRVLVDAGVFSHPGRVN